MYKACAFLAHMYIYTGRAVALTLALEPMVAFIYQNIKLYIKVFLSDCQGPVRGAVLYMNRFCFYQKYLDPSESE